ncbi:MAG: SMI1/KNR4 family protein [Polaribacter sp.]
MINIQEIKEKLDILKQSDSNFTIFGSPTHQYKINPVISLAELEDFEKKYEIKLSEDYRRFLTEIGNGGAGPYFGILPLPMNVDPFDIEYNLKGLKQPFKYEKAWICLRNFLKNFMFCLKIKMRKWKIFFNTFFPRIITMKNI